MLKYRNRLLVVVVSILPLGAGVADEPTQPIAKPPSSYEEARAVTRQMAGYKNLQQIGLAFHGYHDIFGHFPPAVLYGPDKKTPYGWRVELLPVLKHYVSGIEPKKLGSKINREQYNALIAECGYDLSQAWDSDKNRSALEAIPSYYRHPSDKADSTNSAIYAVIGTGTTFDPENLAKYDDITTWPASTLLVVESHHKEPWTKPIDVAYSDSATVPRFGGYEQNGFLALSCDGAVHYISDSVSADDLRAFISKDPNDKFNIVGIPYRYK